MPFEYLTIWKPDNFWPFEYQTGIQMVTVHDSKYYYSGESK